jgi:predicted GNAT family acetyltransferase
MSASVTDNASRSRFELDVSGQTAFIDYRRVGETLYLDHAEVPVLLRGHGVGARLARGALELVRERGERVIPVCSFVESFMLYHPEFADLRAR